MSTTSLDILIRARDEATRVINGVSASGAKVGTSLSSAGAKGTSAMNRVGSAGTSLGSKLKKLGAIVGIAFGVTAVYEFGKKATAAFEAVQKQQKLLGLGLDKIGQAGQLPGLVDQLGKVSSATVTLQGDTDSLASQILAVGHNYFAELGPQASTVLAGLTKGILNISAATHKPVAMLQRSLTLAMINTPAKAIPTLQKLGIITTEQAAHFTTLAKSGDLATLRQQELTAVTGAYPGAAGKSATASERLAKSVDDIKIKVGKTLAPIVDIVAKVADWAANNSALALTLVGGAGVVFALAKVGKIVSEARKVTDAMSGAMLRVAASSWTAVSGFGADVGALISLISTEGIAAIATLSLSDAMATLGGPLTLGALGAALAAGYAIGTMLNHIFKISERLDNLLVNNSINTAASVKTEGDAFQALAYRWKRGQISASDLTTAVDALNRRYGSSISAAGIMARRTTDVGAAAAVTAQKVQRFAGMGEKAFAKWAKQIKTDARSSITSLGGVELATHKTAMGFLHDSNVMARVARQDAKGMKALASSSQSWVPEAYKQWLINQGPGAVANFEKLTSKAQQTAVGDWKTAAGGADAYAKSLSGLSPRSLATARTASDSLARSLATLKTSSPIMIDIYLRQHGRLPGHAGGGDIAVPELAVVGEHGSEIVALPGGAHVYPHGQGPDLGGTSFTRSVQRSERGTVLISIDRRRFTEQADFETRYRGW